MARFAAKGEFENFTDADIPYSDIDLAAKSAADVLSKVSLLHQCQAPPLLSSIAASGGGGGGGGGGIEDPPHSDDMS